MTIIFSGQMGVSGNVGLTKTVNPTTLLEDITAAGLTSNLVLAMDAADINSYSGSGQDWVDTSSAGNADEFHRGATTGSEGSDPTFNGVAGSKSENEYWEFDGNDYFRYGTSNEAWMNNMHKNNAVHTMIVAVYPASGASQTLFDNRITNNRGVSWRMESGSSGMTWQIAPGLNQGENIFNPTGLGYSNGAWNILGISVDEAAGAAGSFVYVNGVETTFDSTYAATSASAASAVAHIGSAGDEGGNFLMTNGTRLAWMAIWDINLTAVQVDALYEEVRTRFSL